MEGYIYIGDLSKDAQTVLEMSVEKFRKGAIEHGELVVRNGDWEEALFEEFIDQAHYAMFQLLKLSQNGER